jgi:4-amino-4-deoxy-L-arabinose transferase-like glycosyltransferase
MTTTSSTPVAAAEPLAPSAPLPSDGVRGSGWSARHFTVALSSVAALGLVVRMMNVFWWRPTTDRVGYLGYRLWGDAFYYHHQANALADGKFFIDPIQYVFDHGVEVPSAGHPPLYSTYLALWSLVGIDSVTAHRVVSSLLGVAAVVLVGLVGKRIAGAAVGLTAAVIVAIYPFMWINDGMVMSESMVVLVAALVLLTAYDFARTPDVRHAIFLGLACGAATLTRTEMALLFPLLVLPLALFARSEHLGSRVKLAVVAGLVGALTIVPWVTFNMVRFDEPVLLSTGIGNTLAYGSCDETYYGRLIGYYHTCFTGPYPENVDESQRDQAPRDYALDYIEDHASRVPLVVAARVGRIWGVFKPGQTTAFDWWIEGRGRVPSWISLFAYYAMIPFAIGGLVVMRRRRVTILPIVVPIVIATFAAATTFGITRYRAPAEVGIVLAAAVGLCAAWSRLGRRTQATVAEKA